MLPDLDPQSQVQVLGLIGDRGDLSTVEPAMKVLTSSDESVRLAAIEALTKVGTDDGAEALFEIAVAGSGAAQKAARDGLAVMAGPRVDEIDFSPCRRRRRESPCGGDRRAGQTTHARDSRDSAQLRRRAENEDICRAAFGALVDVADTVDVATLADLLAKTKSGAARDSGVTALRAALAAAKDKDATAEAVISRMKTADADARIAMLTCLDALGGISGPGGRVRGGAVAR